MIIFCRDSTSMFHVVFFLDVEVTVKTRQSWKENLENLKRFSIFFALPSYCDFVGSGGDSSTDCKWFPWISGSLFTSSSVSTSVFSCSTEFTIRRDGAEISQIQNRWKEINKNSRQLFTCKDQRPGHDSEVTKHGNQNDPRQCWSLRIRRNNLRRRNWRIEQRHQTSTLVGCPRVLASFSVNSHAGKSHRRVKRHFDKGSKIKEKINLTENKLNDEKFSCNWKLSKVEGSWKKKIQIHEKHKNLQLKFF